MTMKNKMILPTTMTMTRIFLWLSLIMNAEEDDTYYWLGHQEGSTVREPLKKFSLPCCRWLVVLVKGFRVGRSCHFWTETRLKSHSNINLCLSRANAFAIPSSGWRSVYIRPVDADLTVAVANTCHNFEPGRAGSRFAVGPPPAFDWCAPAYRSRLLPYGVDRGPGSACCCECRYG